MRKHDTCASMMNTPGWVTRVPLLLLQIPGHANQNKFNLKVQNGMKSLYITLTLDPTSMTTKHITQRLVVKEHQWPHFTRLLYGTYLATWVGNTKVMFFIITLGLVCHTDCSIWGQYVPQPIRAKDEASMPADVNGHYTNVWLRGHHKLIVGGIIAPEVSCVQ